MSWWILGQVFTVIGDSCQIVVFYVVEGKSQRHIPETMVVPVGLTVIGDIDQLRQGVFFGEGIDETAGEVITALEKVLKGYIVGDGTIVEKQIYLSAIPSGFRSKRCSKSRMPQST